MAAVVREALSAAYGTFAASDPGLLRLLLAARGTLSVALTAAAAVGAGTALGVPATELAGAVTLSMMAPFLMREPTLRQRWLTLAALAVPAIGAAVLTASLHGDSRLGDAVFVLLVFGCYLVGPRSSRGTAIGLVAIITTYVGLYLELPPRSLPLQIAGIVGALPIIALACFVILPLHPARALRRTVRAVQWRAAAAVQNARRLADGRQGSSGDDRLVRSLVRLNEATLAADDLLASIEPEGREPIRLALIDLELATGRLIDRVLAGDLGQREAVRLRLHEQRVRRGRPVRSFSRRAGRDGLIRDLVALGGKAHRLGVLAREAASARKPVPPPALPPGPLAWLLAARVTLAAVLAMAAGMALSPNRWFWAVITVYVVFINTRTRGDLIYKGLQRVGGTVLGIASGLGLSLLLAGDLRLEVAVLMVFVFGMFYLFLRSYTAGIFCVTVMLGLLYGLLGAPVEETLLLRLEETAIGAAAGMLVAAFVAPVRTREQVLRSGRNVVAALLDAVRASRARLEGRADGPEPIVTVRQLDRKVADLRLALAPILAGRAVFRRQRLERSIPALLDCVRWARALASHANAHPVEPIRPEPGDGFGRPGVSGQTGVSGWSGRRLGDIEQHLGRLVDGSGPADRPAADLAPDGDDPELADILRHLSAALEGLDKRIELGRLGGWAVD